MDFLNRLARDTGQLQETREHAGRKVVDALKKEGNTARLTEVANSAEYLATTRASAREALMSLSERAVGTGLTHKEAVAALTAGRTSSATTRSRTTQRC